MDCGSQLNLQPCNNCDAVDNRASANCHKCGAQFASIWALAPEPDAVDARPNNAVSSVPAANKVIHDSASTSGELTPESGMLASERAETSTGPRRRWLVLATVTILVSLAVGSFTNFMQPEKLAQRQGLPQVVVDMPGQPPSSTVATQKDGTANTTVLSTKPDIGTVDLAQVLSRATPATAPVSETVASNTVVHFTSAKNVNVNANANANVSYRQKRPALKECAPAVATLGLCDPEPQQENR